MDCTSIPFPLLHSLLPPSPLSPPISPPLSPLIQRLSDSGEGGGCLCQDLCCDCRLQVREGSDGFFTAFFLLLPLLPSLTVILSPLVQQAIGLPWAEGIVAC